MRRLLMKHGVAVSVATAALAGCADHRLPNEPAVSPEFENAAAFTCVASVRAQTVSCVRPEATIGGGNADIRIGKQGEHIQLTSSNVAYAGTQFTFDVTVQNLLAQPLGTSDGTTPDANGVRIFFLADPVATIGSGAITVAGDGVGTFTTANQPYYEYSGPLLGADEILTPNETSVEKLWTLNIPGTVDEFSFRVLVAAEVPYPDGYIAIAPARDTMLQGQFQALSATVRDAYGAPIAGTINWSTSDVAVATVDAAGNISATGPGTATITATSGTLFGTATIAVCADLAVGASYTPTTRDFCLAGGATGMEYTIVPTNTATTDLNYSIAGTGIVPVVGAPSPDVIAGFRTLDAQQLRRDDAWEYRLRERERQQLEALRRTGMAGVIGSRIPGGIQPAITPGVPAVGDLMSINVNSEELCTDPIMRDARVKAVGEHIIVMADESNPAGLSDTDYEDIAWYFDTQIYPLITQNFGVPSDIDGNGRVIVLFTAAVNDLSAPGSGLYAGGFSLERDLSDAVSCPGSNVGELFYMLAADPAGIHGNVFGRQFVEVQARVTFAHELQHLINSSYRLANGHNSETTWLNEGLSYIAEELLFYRETGFGPGLNIGLQKILSDLVTEERFFAYAEPNFSRLREWLINPTASGPFASDDALSTRGATWAFLRYAADRSGGDEPALWSGFITSAATGTANIAGRFGIDPNAWFRDWAAAMYIDDTGGPGINPANQNPSWDFRDYFDAFGYGGAPKGFPLAMRDPVDGIADTYTLAGGGASAFHRVGVPANGFAAVTGNTTPGANFGLTVIRTK